MKRIINLFVALCLSSSAFAQKDTLHVYTGKQQTYLLAPGSYGVRGKVLTGPAGIYSTGLAKTSPDKTGDTSLVVFQAISNKFTINTLVAITNNANHRTILAVIKDALGKSAAKRGDLVALERDGLKALGTAKSSLKIKIQSFVLSDSLSNKYLTFDTTPIIESAQPADTSANTFTVIGKEIKGIASFYSANLEGTKTATGEIFRHRQLTAASNNFKLNTWVLVTNLKNQKSVIVRINDRMHPRMKKKGRVVDLTRAAAALLDFMEDGLAKVKVAPVKFIHVPVQQSPADSLQSLIKNDSLAMSDSAKIDSVKTIVKEEEAGLKGIASFYSANLDGTKTATGEIFRNNKLSAASNDFPLNTWVRVTNVKNNKYVILRINDRMHPRMKKKGRIVDLSRAAARKLDFIKSGVTQVRVEVVTKDTVD